MVISKTNETNECKRFRIEWDGGLSKGADNAARIDDQGSSDHASSCKDCRLWLNEMQAITDCVHQMPQFDVPELVTQKIISAVRDERAVGRADLYRNLLWLGALSCGAWMLLVYDSFESWNGTLAWLIALAGVASLKFLIGTNVEHEAILEK